MLWYAAAHFRTVPVKDLPRLGDSFVSHKHLPLP